MALRKKDGFKGQRLIVIPESIRRILIENPITNSLYLSDIGYYPKASMHYCERRRGTPEDILIYCVDGEGWIEADNRSFHLTANQFFIINMERIMPIPGVSIGCIFAAKSPVYFLRCIFVSVILRR